MAVKKQDAKAAPKRKAAKKPFDFQLLRRTALWGLAALCAIALAVLTSRTEAGAERLAVMLASLRGQSAPPAFDARVETRKVANGLRALSADNEQLRSKLTAVEGHTDAVERHMDGVERHMDDVTGSLRKQIEAVKAEAEAPRPADTPPAPATPNVSGTTAAPAPPPTATPPLPQPAPPARVQTPPPVKPANPGSSSSAAPNQYGVDIGSAVSAQALRARWTEIRAAHPQLFQGLTATVVVRAIPQSDRSELRLVLGALPNSDAATRLCNSLAPYRVFCQPTGFDGQHVALQ
ncbi:MAG: hypothetical protein WB760_12130 [Xanthobacteraceae bacterium]